MNFVVFTDGTANLPEKMLDGIHLLPCNYMVDDEVVCYEGDIDKFDGAEYYEALKNGCKVKTSLLNTQLFIEHFEPFLKDGKDIIYVSMSSGISGTFNAARLAAEELKDTFPGREIIIIDSRGCGFGSGLLAVKAAKLSKDGVDAREAGALLNDNVPHICQYFTVDDLNFLKATGRVSGSTAKIATVLDIKPILYGTADGQIVSHSKVRGRKAAIDALAKMYAEKVVDADKQTVCISHGNCEEDAKKLAARISEINKPADIVICPHEPFSGSHVGPGMLALFFYGRER